MTEASRDVDVLIVGAGLSGICAAAHLEMSCPKKTYAILEARERLGGTWDLFRYPGIRSDSDMYTLGYSFKPWTQAKAIADGPSILAYVREAAEERGIDRKIRYQHRVESVRWSSADARWTVDVRDLASAQANDPKRGIVRFTCRFLFICAGYYDYDDGYTPEFPGRETFEGRIVHPQKWTEDIDYDGKRVVVIGSGATAVTLVPELAKCAKRVTMLQRSPSYILSLPSEDKVAEWMRARLPAKPAYAINRWKNVLRSLGFYLYSRRYPKGAKKLLVSGVKQHLRGSFDVDPHFVPEYNPWDQRLCLVPDADLFKAIRSGRADVVTDHVEKFEPRGIRLKSGRLLEADLVVTATGLKLKFIGGIQVEVDGKRIETSKTLIYKGMMCSDVPNLAFAIGYTNASWTLKCDLASAYVCRLLNFMDEHGYAQCCPRRDPTVEEQPLIDFTSGYVARARDHLPKQGSVAPWKLRQNYALDLYMFTRTRVDDPAMEFKA
jgi:monooxygenase